MQCLRVVLHGLPLYKQVDTTAPFVKRWFSHGSSISEVALTEGLHDRGLNTDSPNSST